ncbi:hypothetical protein SD81_011300 [Tolypothrix campylonemoides VB511288]|nr:hypothetical protein SD81_011300 [Tolypothrix campylonemoides VB511288]
MQLKGKQFRYLQEALLGAFPNRAKLKQMVRFGLDENLDAIATGENDEEVVFKLIYWAETNGNLENLLIAARNEDCGGNFGNRELKRICEELLQGQTAREQSHALMNPCKFDFLPPISFKDVQLSERRFIFVPQFPLTYREVAQAWRRLRRPVRVGPPTELDVEPQLRVVVNRELQLLLC